MKSKLIGSLFVVLTLVVGIIAFVPSAFADEQVTITKGAGGSANAACVTTSNCFTPNPVNVSPGDTVTWTNTDTVLHTVTSGKIENTTGNIIGAVFDSQYTLTPGKTFSHTFTAADVGTINYYCQVHPWMTGMVTVGATQTNGGNMTTNSGNMTTNNSTATPEFGPVASLVLVIAIVSVVAVTAKTRGFLKL
jgi:predicted secreted protein with PEFG-CTERM motif